MKTIEGVNGLEDHLGYWLRYVSNQVSSAFAAKVSGHGITVAEWVVLRVLYSEEGIMPSLLAERLGMTRSAISRLVDRVEAKGLLQRRSTTSDKRAHTLSLTAKGSRLVPTIAKLADENDRDFFGHLSPELRDTIQNAMKDIVRRRGLKVVPVD